MIYAIQSIYSIYKTVKRAEPNFDPPSYLIVTYTYLLDLVVLESSPGISRHTGPKNVGLVRFPSDYSSSCPSISAVADVASTNNTIHFGSNTFQK